MQGEANQNLDSRVAKLACSVEFLVADLREMRVQHHADMRAIYKLMFVSLMGIFTSLMGLAAVLTKLYGGTWSIGGRIARAPIPWADVRHDLEKRLAGGTAPRSRLREHTARAARHYCCFAADNTGFQM